MILSVTGFIAVTLTIAMFATKQSMLGFACLIFWAIMGAYAYTVSVTTWDIYYFLFFACLVGMVPFTALAAWGLREPRDTLADEELDEEVRDTEKEEKYIDEGSKVGEIDKLFSVESEESKPSTRTEALRDRAKKRRTRDRRDW